jgi:hypothetical protein
MLNQGFSAFWYLQNPQIKIAQLCLPPNNNCSIPLHTPKWKILQIRSSFESFLHFCPLWTICSQSGVQPWLRITALNVLATETKRVIVRHFYCNWQRKTLFKTDWRPWACVIKTSFTGIPNVHFFVINLKVTAKCMYSQSNVRINGHLTVQVQNKAYFFHKL